MELALRPTFTIDLAEPCGAVLERMRVALASQASVETKWSRVPGARSEQPNAGAFAWLAMPADQQKFWSPWLQVSVMPTEDGAGTQLFGRFSPRPAVWTGFALAYLGLTCIGFFSLMVGLSLLMVKQTPWTFWVGGAAVVAMGSLYWASLTGKRFANQQMAVLKRAVEEAVLPRLPLAGERRGGGAFEIATASK